MNSETSKRALRLSRSLLETLLLKIFYISFISDSMAGTFDQAKMKFSRIVSAVFDKLVVFKNT